LPRGREVVGGTAFDLFGGNGCVQEGDFTLKVWEGLEGDGVTDKTIGLQNTEISRLEVLTRRRNEGIMPAVPWLEEMTSRKIAITKQAEKKKREWLHLGIYLPRFDSRVIYCEVSELLLYLSASLPHPYQDVCCKTCKMRFSFGSFGLSQPFLLPVCDVGVSLGSWNQSLARLS
jgi:hypothetical protein